MSSPNEGGWLLSGFVTQIGLWIWVVVVLAYALIRSVSRPNPDPIRPSGPGGD